MEVTMRGVIIWHCKTTERAVVWCDDSGELAYAGGEQSWANPGTRVAIGDYVAFELQPFSAARSCKNMRLIEQGMAPELAGILSNMRNGPVAATARSESPVPAPRPTARPAARHLYAVPA
jgi:hypothetical protein